MFDPHIDQTDQFERRMQAEHQNIMRARMMNSTQSMVNPSLLNGVITSAIANGAVGTSASNLMPKKKPRVNMHCRIEQVFNGFNVIIDGETHIAASLEDVNAIITSELASQMLDRAE